MCFVDAIGASLRQHVASMAAVVRAAVARALSRSVEADDVFACAVTSSDFDDAVEDVRRSQMPIVLED